MKKVILGLCILALTTPIVSAEVDYAFEAYAAFQKCLTTHTQCKEHVDYVKQGIAYYKNGNIKSDYDLKSYCALLTFSINSQAWGDREQLKRDGLERLRVCGY